MRKYFFIEALFLALCVSGIYAQTPLVLTGSLAHYKYYTATATPVINTAALTTFLTFTIPANDLADKQHIYLEYVDSCLNNIAGPPNYTITVDIGGNNFTTTSVNFTSQSAVVGYQTRGFFFTRVGNDVWVIFSPPGNNSLGGAGGQFAANAGGRIQGVNFANSNTVNMKMTLSSASASLYFAPYAPICKKEAP